ncbi:MAG: hypothetical protein JW759_06635 [Candidatus Coatesbacteria bacterium]|nr:hypothetical protein [Candidatus Coatesbacteria bacterium]
MYSEVREMFRAPALIAYLVDRLLSKKQDMQVGKTRIQKMIFLFSRRTPLEGIDFALHHYGTYSGQLDHEMMFGQRAGLLDVECDPRGQYFVKPGEKAQEFYDDAIISQPEKEAVEKIVDEYGDWSVAQLSLLATALFVKEQNPDSDLKDLVKGIKPFANEADLDKAVDAAIAFSK